MFGEVVEGSYTLMRIYEAYVFSERMKLQKYSNQAHIYIG